MRCRPMPPVKSWPKPGPRASMRRVNNGGSAYGMRKPKSTPHRGWILHKMRRHIGRGSRQPYTWKRRVRPTRKLGDTYRLAIPTPMMSKPSALGMLVGGPTMKAYGREITTDPTMRRHIRYLGEPRTHGGA